ncbi:MAG: RsmE family RNA methyltransferase [Candidatus Baltobacteraceae bacterium]
MTFRRHGRARFFVDGVCAQGETVVLEGSDARKLSVVLRAEPGDAVEICDSAGQAFTGRIVEPGARVEVVLEAELSRPHKIAEVEIILAQAIPKGAKMDFVVEKATELGVGRIVPLVTERTLGDEGREGKVERWRRLARAAAQQSGRLRIPSIEAPVRWSAFVERADELGRVLVPWELAPRTPLRECLPPLLANARTLTVAIGPEGGLTHAEVDAARERGAVAISLGARILRTETAGLVAVCAVRYAAGEL